jgi:Rha family phage regulatory protein
MEKTLPPVPQKINALPIVAVHQGRVITTSLKISELFNKPHKSVLRAIENLECPSDFWRHNFVPRDYVDGRGKTQPSFEITRDGFMLVGMGFNGRRAVEWKIKVIQAFNEMECLLSQRQSLAWQEARATGKLVRRSETDTIQEFVIYATAQGSRNAHWYYRNLTTLVYSALGFKDTHRPIRDMLTPQQAAALTLIESAIADVLRSGMEIGEHYQQIYRAAAGRVMELASVLVPAARLLAA